MDFRHFTKITNMSLKDRLRVILMFSECENCDYMPKNAEKRRFIALMQKKNERHF